MAGSLPDELIVRIAEKLVESVEPQQHLTFSVFLRGVGERVRRHPKSFKRWSRNDTPCSGHANISPLALALFSPVLLEEYIKILFETKVFHFHTSAYLYAFINASGISEAALQRRRSIRFLQLSKWGDCDCRDCCPWRQTLPAPSPHGFDRSLGPAIRLMPRVTTVHINRYPMTDTYYKLEAESYILTALQPVFMRNQDLSTELFDDYGTSTDVNAFS
ncbi:hypothetical protein IWZ01DRAFT_542385 [Phyllosticta capitalensis]